MEIDVHDDVRLIQRQLAKGFVSREDVIKRFEDLPDVAEKGEWIEIQGEGNRPIERA